MRTADFTGSGYELFKGDCIPWMQEAVPQSVDMSVFSPPFPSLYAYTSEACDIGNSEGLRNEARLHLGYFYRGLSRVLKPGRVAIVHVCQIPRMKRSGEVGLCDFRGMNIRLGERAGLVYEYDWLIRKNPQSQAIRTKSRELQFSGLESDRAKSRGAIADYLIKFRAPGENAARLSDDSVSRDSWIRWAESHWDDIRETETLNVAEGRGVDDTKHICPLQLEVIRRCVLLFSGPDETVFSPFAGIGSEGYIALLNGRKFIGCEIKDEYIRAAARNMERAISRRATANANLFEMAG